ncbi:MAG: HAEPLYID family protein [Salibacteraceae bacterium]
MKDASTFGFLLFSLFSTNILAQTDSLSIAELDSLYIFEIEDKKTPDKVLHAEPLYIDLIRDLGARKGEKEWNVGFGMTDKTKYDSFEALVEYEWAPINRLGFEVETPFTFYAPVNGAKGDSIPSDRLESLKLATQWSFFVNERIATSMAIGYINEFEFSDFNNFGQPLITGNVYNPFFVFAKRWQNNYHTLVYTGPTFVQHFGRSEIEMSYEVNTNFHYMISGTRNFIGIEFNKTFREDDFDMTIRPQMRLGIADNFLIGIIAGIPVDRETERLSSFVRIIWEPGHKKVH